MGTKGSVPVRATNWTTTAIWYRYSTKCRISHAVIRLSSFPERYPRHTVQAVTRAEMADYIRAAESLPTAFFAENDYLALGFIRARSFP